MKNWLVKISAPLLTTCMLWGTWISGDFASALFFGEYKYPTNTKEK